MSAEPRRREPPPLEVAEDALILLKRLDAGAWVPYSAGTCLFAWALLWFWAFMSRNAQAAGRLWEFSLLLALAYAAMKACHAHFFIRLMAAVQEDPEPRVGTATLAKAALYQACVQPLSLAAIPASILLTVPYPFATAFFQSALWVRPGDTPATWLGRSAEMARFRPRQNAWLQAFLAAAWLCVAGNVFTAMAIGPALLKSLLGIDTVFSRSDATLLNTTVLAMVLILAWAVIDPFKKAIHAVRCLQGISRRTGLDLELELSRHRPAARPVLSRAGAIGTAILILSLCASPAGAVSADPARRPTLAAEVEVPPAVDPERLDALLRAEIGESRYGWRLPRGADPGADQSWLRLQFRKLMDAAESARDRLAGWGRKIGRWLNRFLPGDAGAGDAGGSGSASRTRIRVFLAALFLLFAAMAAFLLLRRSRRVPIREAAPVAAAPASPDASSEDAKADDFPEDAWLEQAASLRAKGEERLALRALFLATLSLLARKGWLTVARHKGNRDYQREVAARARRREGVAEAFGENCRRFDRVWYGRHPVTGEDWEVCRANFDAVRAHEA